MNPIHPFCLNSLNIPWCIFGDFNSILGAHEHRSFSSPSNASILDFRAWVNDSSLIEFPAKSSTLTWHNGRSGSASIERRLDRAFGN
ncbi:unnamed protein product [Lathyrus sativus]|nr:unnamed protein product [Lathyrus sativus]